jgi:alpha-D-ribose 1-methylphosphonate 5-triphosphate synthase subunit PhnL
MLDTLAIAQSVLRLEGVSKNFTLHLREGLVLPVVQDVSLEVAAGECVVLDGPSGIGKSSILKMIYGNYLAGSGSIQVRHAGDWIDIAGAQPRQIIELRRNVIGYVSQFLRVIPRISCLDLVVARARESEADEAVARARASDLLSRLNVPERLWGLAPATFSGGEQQRVNIACGFAPQRPLMLLDEPTASLDTINSNAVISLIEECKARGAGILGIFHDPAVRDRVADRLVDVRRFSTGSSDDA